MTAFRTMLAALSLSVLVACGETPLDVPTGGESTTPSSQGAEGTSDPHEVLPWGPTAGELAEAQQLVASWSPEQLAGQVIVGRFYGTDPQEPADLVRDLHLAGVQITSTSITDEEQLRAMTTAVAEAHAADGREFPPVIGVDQEGGVVSHLSGIATEYPPFADAGEALVQDRRRGQDVVRGAAFTTGLELRDLGFTWVFAPVADVTMGAADPTIGTRSPSDDPHVAAAAVSAAVSGYDAAGIVSTVKHFPGHGGATSDSHEGLPVLTTGLNDLVNRDIAPFRAAIEAHAPAVMVGHLDVQAIAPGVPSSLAPDIYAYLRNELGFEGVAITDSLGMGAVVATRKPALAAINAGADLLLMPADTRLAHRTLTQAIESGEISRERIEEAASRVVAMQLWQERVAGDVPVPQDVREQAEAASAALAEAAG